MKERSLIRCVQSCSLIRGGSIGGLMRGFAPVNVSLFSGEIRRRVIVNETKVVKTKTQRIRVQLSSSSANN